MCFTLNSQSIHGASEVAKKAAANARDSKGGVFPVATRIDRSEKLKLQASRRIAREAFKNLPTHLKDDDAIDRYWGEVEVPYESFYTYKEVLAPFADEPSEIASVLTAAERLTGHLVGDTSFRMAAMDEAVRTKILARYLRTMDSALDPWQTASQACGEAGG